MTGKHPRLRSHTRKRQSGRVVTYYVYDMRGTGRPDVALGSDYEAALRRWDELHNRAPRVAGTLQEAFDRWSADVLPTYGNANTRRGYDMNLRRIAPVFGPATWGAVTLGVMKQYLAKRSGKTQANREMALLSVVWNWARCEGLTELPFPAARMGRWKNKENARRFEVTDDLFAAVYAHADQILRDAMDIASATGLRLTDVRTVPLPAGGVLRVQANKTGKAAAFDIAASPVLSAIVARRREYKAAHLKLLSTPTREVTADMLRNRWDDARAKAAAERPDIAEQVRAMYLRDMRKRAADLADSDSAAADLLQHDDVRLTRRHYRTTAANLKPVR